MPGGWLATGEALGEGTITHTRQPACKKPLEVQVLTCIPPAPKRHISKEWCAYVMQVALLLSYLQECRSLSTLDSSPCLPPVTNGDVPVAGRCVCISRKAINYSRHRKKGLHWFRWSLLVWFLRGVFFSCWD